MGIHPEKKRAGDIVFCPVARDCLSYSQNMVLIKTIIKGRPSVPRGAEANEVRRL